MATENITGILVHTVDPCPKCGKRHDYKLKVVSKELREAIFGGPGGSDVLFTCPNTNEPFTQLIPNPSSGEIDGLATKEEAASLPPWDQIIKPVTPAPTELSPVDADFAEWIKNSRDTAIDFCNTMLTSSTGAIPIYFAVLNYIGFDKISNTPLARAGVLPPIMFLIAAIFFILALRPRFENIAQKEFAAFRARRLTQINQFIIAGTLTLGGAIALAIVLFFYALL